MAKLLLVLFATCVLSSIAATAHVSGNPFLLKGTVYCDSCRCGYETEASTPLSRAIVKIECKSRKTNEVTYTKHGITDTTGTYKIPVRGDRGDDYCDVLLVKSSDPECSEPNSGRDRARIILTGNNGMNSNYRFANAMGFLKRTPLASCSKILKKYQEDEVDE